MKMTGLQLLFVALLSTPVIVAEDLDPVEFLISKNYSRNRTLISLPKDFDKFGDQKNDCCALQLFFEVNDYNADGTGSGDGYSDNESQTETGSVTFNFEHPEIRKSDIKFTMSVEKDKDKVKSKHLLNFDNCTNIIYKTFNISATTTIVDVKDVRVVLVNGIDQKIVCSDPNLAPDPREDEPDNINEYLFIIAALGTVWLGAQAPAPDPQEDQAHYIFVLLCYIEALTIVLLLTILCICNEKWRPGSKSDSDSSDEERGSENNIKSSGGQTRGKKTSTEGVDKCGWITNIRKNNKPLFFSGVITCVWCVLCVITAGIMLPYIL